MQCIFFYKYAINLQISNRKKARKKKTKYVEIKKNTL